MSDYATFLESKRKVVHETGVDVSGQVHPLLHDWQGQIVEWAAKVGRAAIFADCGLGKTFMQVEWARMVSDRSLILAPLSVARQTVRESHKIDADVRYVRSPDEVTGSGVWITNYEMADRFNPEAFEAVVLDESSILKNFTGSTRTSLIRQWAGTRFRLACTATPAPNDVTELTNHAEFLGAMPRNEMLAAFFVHDDDGWRLKGHAVEPMYQWMSSWAVALRTPSDLGYPDDGYILPPMTVTGEVVHSEIDQPGQLFATDLGGIGGRHAVRRATLDARVARTVEIASGPGQWIVWCGLNDEADAVAAIVEGAVNVKGSDSPESKANTLEAFQDQEVRVLVTKPSIAGFGMNFQQCHQMAFVGLSDSYEAYYQAIRRCWRFGQTREVDVRIVLSELEQQIAHNVEAKESHANQMTARLVRAMHQNGWKEPAHV